MATTPRASSETAFLARSGPPDVSFWPVHKLIVDRRSVSFVRYCKDAGAESNSTLSPSALPFRRGWKKNSDVTLI